MIAKDPTQHDREIGERLRVYRNAHRMSQSVVADELGISFQQLQKYEKGRNRIPAARLQRLAILYGVPVQDLLDPAPATVPPRALVQELLSVVDQIQDERILRSLLRVAEAALDATRRTDA